MYTNWSCVCNERGCTSAQACKPKCPFTQRHCGEFTSLVLLLESHDKPSRGMEIKETTGRSTLTRGSDEGQSPLKLFSADDVIGVLPAFSA